MLSLSTSVTLVLSSVLLLCFGYFMVMVSFVLLNVWHFATYLLPDAQATTTSSPSLPCPNDCWNPSVPGVQLFRFESGTQVPPGKRAPSSSSHTTATSTLLFFKFLSTPTTWWTLLGASWSHSAWAPSSLLSPLFFFSSSCTGASLPVHVSTSPPATSALNTHCM